MDLIQHNRNQKTKDSGDNHISDHGNKDNQTEIQVSVNEIHDDACHDTVGGTVDDAQQNLL